MREEKTTPINCYYYILIYCLAYNNYYRIGMPNVTGLKDSMLANPGSISLGYCTYPAAI